MMFRRSPQEQTSAGKAWCHSSLPAIIATLTIAGAFFLLNASASERIRTELQFEDLPGYVTLKCDFHMHTVFSDGAVWPSMRVEEAWRDGLDAIAITDHVEYQPHRADVTTNHLRAWDIARVAAEPLGIIVIPAAEITRGEPPGHLNALFLKTTEPLRKANDCDVIQAAAEQGAFVFWNHPGWKQPGRKSVWYAEQGEFYDRGWLQGIEVVNGKSYDPIAHQWCLDKHLAMLADSDIHGPIGWDYDARIGESRPMTLVLATNRSEGAIYDALRARRTVLFAGNQLLGDAQYLEPLFAGALEIKGGPVLLTGKQRAWVAVFNRSPVSFSLASLNQSDEVITARGATLHAGRTSLIELSAKDTGSSGRRSLTLPFRVTNLLTAPGKGLETELTVEVIFHP